MIDRIRHGRIKRAIAGCLCCLLLICLTLPVRAAEGKGASDRCEICIVHTNDIHGYYTRTDGGSIGFAYLKTLVNQVDADLILDIGDTFHGQAFATVEQGQGIAELMRQIGYDAMTVGNHDWSYGANRLKVLEAAGGIPILASNVMTDGGEAFFNTPYIVKTVSASDGTRIKVGIVGVIDDAFYHSTASGNVEGLVFEEEAKAATEAASYLKENEGCGLVLAITHQSDPEGFVRNISGIDAVIAGHEHILLNEKYTDAEGRKIPVVEAGSYFYDIGVLTLSVDKGSMTINDAKETVYTLEELDGLAPNKRTEEQIAAIENREEAVLDVVIGRSEAEYPYSWEELRVSQQPIGKIVTAAYLDKTGADVAIENAGGIRAGIPAGDVTYRDLISISPYGNTLVTKELTGREILDLLELSLEIGVSCDKAYALQKEAAARGEDPYQYSWPEDSGSYLQFNGITLKCDMNKKPGSRILSAQIGGKKLKSNGRYIVATNNYIAENSFFSALAEAGLQTEYGTCEEAIRDYIAKGNFGN